MRTRRRFSAEFKAKVFDALILSDAFFSTKVPRRHGRQFPSGFLKDPREQYCSVND